MVKDLQTIKEWPEKSQKNYEITPIQSQRDDARRDFF